VQQGPVATLLANQLVFGDRLTVPRSLAFLLDLGLCAGLAWAYLDWQNGWPADGFEQVVSVLQATVVILVLYRFVCLALTGTTLGMRLLRLRLVDVDGDPPTLSQALGRSVATYLVILPFAATLGALFAPRYQVLQDMLSETRVVRG
jgi:uncharacterized RDD family membrane protein YckC